MTTKTISIENDAYELLAKEKRGRESFSQVIRRNLQHSMKNAHAFP